jgi:hypothetical protein
MDALATLIAVIALLASLANVGYHAALGSAARGRAGGGEVSTWVRGKVAPTAGATLGALVALVMSGGGAVVDVLAVLVAVGSAAVAARTLQSTRGRFPTTR